jgi:phage terminase large subunit
MPKIQLPRKAQPILTTKAKIIVLVGGRSSAKSESVGRILLQKCQVEGADVLCGREFQNSIDESVHKLFKGLIQNIPVPGFNVDKQKIDCNTGGGIRFRGLDRSPSSIQSYQNFKYFWGEEAHAFSQETIDVVIPTFRSEGYQLYFTANPQSSADPFSKRFILPFLANINANGFYEDDMHLVIQMNWRDNPWHGELEPQRVWDFENLSRAKYDWIWEGAFNDSVEDALIMAEWFDACIDAHKRLGFKPEGIRFSSHDPSDTGPDNKGFAFRHGSVVLDIQEKTDGDINEGCDWATGLAINYNSDAFTWDCDGMGVGLNQQVTRAFDGKPIVISQFKGSEGVDNPDAKFDPADKAPVQNQKTIKDAVKNKRGQYYLRLRQCMYRTYEAIEKGIYHDPDTLISFDSSIELLPKLRSELCRMPVKPNGAGKFELYTKPEMKSKFKFDSPNLADPVMMLMRTPHQSNIINFRMPQPIKPIGRTLENRRRRICR